MTPVTNKQYGSVTLDDIKLILKSLPELQSIYKEVNQALSHDANVRKILTPPFYWSKLYEQSLVQHVAITMESLGIIEKFLELSESGSDETSKIMSFLYEPPEDIVYEELPRERKQLIIITLYSLYLTLESILIHGESINHLVQKVQKGNDEALFKIIQIDRSAVSCPCIADRIALAELEQDQEFFDSLQKAFNGPSKKIFISFRELRFLLELLSEDGTLDSLSIEDEYQLFCVELDLYSVMGSDPAKSLHQFILRWKKDRST